jgi:hypothetical protein
LKHDWRTWNRRAIIEALLALLRTSLVDERLHVMRPITGQPLLQFRNHPIGGADPLTAVGASAIALKVVGLNVGSNDTRVDCGVIERDLLVGFDIAHRHQRRRVDQAGIGIARVVDIVGRFFLNRNLPQVGGHLSNQNKRPIARSIHDAPVALCVLRQSEGGRTCNVRWRS